MDLERYFERVGHDGPVRADLETLHALTRAHAQSIPFENLDVILRRPISLEPADLHEKLVARARGGYCFEQNGLLLDVLRRIGFEAWPLRAAVRLAQPDRSIPARHTHLLLGVRLAGQVWLTDVGVGAASLTAALRLEADLEQPTPHDRRRLQRQGDAWFHQLFRAGQWVDVYQFDGRRMPLADQEVANWFTSTCPDARFMDELIAARALPGGRRASLRDRQLSLRGPGDELQVRELPDAPALREALAGHFGVRLDEWPVAWPHLQAAIPALRDLA